jgi:hypothetical protein
MRASTAWRNSRERAAERAGTPSRPQRGLGPGINSTFADCTTIDTYDAAGGPEFPIGTAGGRPADRRREAAKRSPAVITRPDDHVSTAGPGE